ncbi:hypothetical protein C2845_PM14G13590 [Panicum miliaceum]|uniref:Uncharacterized protein n=1 Tax=Panicum miliaceum TaxID=4540 RepID=A0A3L6PTL6_PANMI|nr:hypothetical protein C2845_PM14G13590 [Panicum miliaceum]
MEGKDDGECSICFEASREAAVGKGVPVKAAGLRARLPQSFGFTVLMVLTVMPPGSCNFSVTMRRPATRGGTAGAQSSPPTTSGKGMRCFPETGTRFTSTFTGDQQAQGGGRCPRAESGFLQNLTDPSGRAAFSLVGLAGSLDFVAT